MIKLFVVGIPRNMDETELAEIIKPYLEGEVTMVKIVSDQQTGESKGYGFVGVESLHDADLAITALDGATIDDRQISVRIAQENQKPAPQTVVAETSTGRPKRPRRKTS